MTAAIPVCIHNVPIKFVCHQCEFEKQSSPKVYLNDRINELEERLESLEQQLKIVKRNVPILVDMLMSLMNLDE